MTDDTRICPSCQGSGEGDDDDMEMSVCPRCCGTGEVPYFDDEDDQP